MKKILIIAILAGLGILNAGVFEDYQPSARARGMGGAFTGVADDVNALFFNPAGLTQTKYGFSAGIANIQNQEFTEFKTIAAGYALPKGLGTVAIGGRLMDVEFEDENLMAEQTWSIGHGFTLLNDIHSQIFFGYSGNLYRLSFEGEDPSNAFGVDVGGMAILHQRTRLGFSVQNINQPKMGDQNQVELPMKLAMGVSYIPYEGVNTTIELRKDFAAETEFMAGAEYQMFEPLAIRAGVHLNEPVSWNAGATFSVRKFCVDYSFSSHAVLAGTHYINLGYKF